MARVNGVLEKSPTSKVKLRLTVFKVKIIVSLPSVVVSEDNVKVIVDDPVLPPSTLEIVNDPVNVAGEKSDADTVPVIVYGNTVPLGTFLVERVTEKVPPSVVPGPPL